jgi:hypothetical protein
MSRSDAMALLALLAGVAILAVFGLLDVGRSLWPRTARLARHLAAVQWREVPGRIAGHATVWLLFLAAGKHAGRRVLPEPAPGPCPWEPAERPDSGGQMPSAWRDPHYVSPAEQRDRAQQPTQTYDIKALLAAAQKEAQDELEAWWLA